MSRVDSDIRVGMEWEVRLHEPRVNEEFLQIT